MHGALFCDFGIKLTLGVNMPVVVPLRIRWSKSPKTIDMLSLEVSELTMMLSAAASQSGI